MQLNPYLVFDGRCEEAFRFYEKCLGGKIATIMAFAGTPAEAHVPENYRGKVMHARLEIDGQVLMGSDDMPGGYQKPRGFSVSLHVKDVKQGERVFNALADGGKITMPFEKTFWAARFGMVTDRFGIPWMVNCE